GTNQAETHPVTFAHLLRERARTKARLVVVDPRQTPTAASADEWLAPKPHTDLALVLALLHHNLYDKSFVRRWVVGFEELDQHVRNKGYTAEWAEGCVAFPPPGFDNWPKGTPRPSLQPSSATPESRIS